MIEHEIIYLTFYFSFQFKLYDLEQVFEIFNILFQINCWNFGPNIQWELV